MSVIDTGQQRLLPDLEPTRRIFVITGLASGFALPVQSTSAADQAPSSQVATGGRHHMEIIISPSREVVTLINVFAVQPEHQHDLIDLLKEGTERWMSKMPGYVSASSHKSKDGRRVINYSQWRSVPDIEAMRQNPDVRPYLQRVAALAKSEAIVCDVSYVHHA
jgi:quinol monooxygenase YgiN